MKRKFLCSVVTMSMVAALVGCGSSASDSAAANDEESTQVEDDIPEETAEDTAEEIVEEAEEETEEDVTEIPEQEVPFAEENGLQFSDLSPLEIPGFEFFTDSDGNYLEEGPEGVSLIQPTIVYTFGDITVSDPDEDDNVVYTISYTKEYEFAYEAPENYSEFYFNVNSDGICFLDYYTGTVFPARDTSGDASYEISTDIVWDDVTYSVGYTKSIEWTHGDWQQDGNILSIPYSSYSEYTVTAPADYDGLVIYIDNRGITEYEEYDYENFTEAHTFGTEEDESIDDCTFIRVSDYVTQ